MKYKALVRADGNNILGMGDIICFLNLVSKLKNFDVLFLSKYEEGIKKIKDNNYEVEKISQNITLQEEIELIKKINKKFNSDIILTISNVTLIPGEEKFLPESKEYFKELSKISKNLVIDVLGGIEVYSDILVNWDALPTNLNYVKKNPKTAYYLGSEYIILKDEIIKYHNSNKKMDNEVKNVLITFGGSDRRNLTPKAIETLKTFKEIEFNIIVGSAFNNKDGIIKVLEKNKLKHNLIENPNNILELIYSADLAISSGGLTAFELATIGTPFIAYSTTPWEARRLKMMHELGICKYLGEWNNFKENELHKEFLDLASNRNERERISKNGKKFVDGRGAERVAEIIMKNLLH